MKINQIGIIFVILIVLIGISSTTGFSKNMSTVKMDNDCSMWIENMTVHPGETNVLIPVHGSWSFTISGYQICIQFNNNIIEIIDVHWFSTIGQDAFIQDWIFPYPDVLLIGVFWMPGSYKSAGSGVLAFLMVNISGQIQPGETILDLSNLGGTPPIDCIYSDESSVEHYPELTDGALFIVKCADIDSNGNGPDIADLVYLVDYMFQGGPSPGDCCNPPW